VLDMSEEDIFQSLQLIHNDFSITENEW